MIRAPSSAAPQAVRRTVCGDHRTTRSTTNLLKRMLSCVFGQCASVKEGCPPLPSAPQETPPKQTLSSPVPDVTDPAQHLRTPYTDAIYPKYLSPLFELESERALHPQVHPVRWARDVASQCLVRVDAMSPEIISIIMGYFDTGIMDVTLVVGLCPTCGTQTMASAGAARWLLSAFRQSSP